MDRIAPQVVVIVEIFVAETADDSLIVRIVLERHQELFHAHCH
jgi:hypothetical protein